MSSNGPAFELAVYVTPHAFAFGILPLVWAPDGRWTRLTEERQSLAPRGRRSPALWTWFAVGQSGSIALRSRSGRRVSDRHAEAAITVARACLRALLNHATWPQEWCVTVPTYLAPARQCRDCILRSSLNSAPHRPLTARPSRSMFAPTVLHPSSRPISVSWLVTTPRARLFSSVHVASEGAHTARSCGDELRTWNGFPISGRPSPPTRSACRTCDAESAPPPHTNTLRTQADLALPDSSHPPNQPSPWPDLAVSLLKQQRS